MIFGKTDEQKMEGLGKPRKWFAWRPVQLEDGRGAWLTTVWRIKDGVQIPWRGLRTFYVYEAMRSAEEE